VRIRLWKHRSLRVPLALAVVGELASSTLLSLFLVPVIFMMLAHTDSAPRSERDAREVVG
jgi:Cu/Ag efflux pump CusA